MHEQKNISQTPKFGKYFKFVMVIGTTLAIILIGAIFMNLDSLREPIMEKLSEITGLSIEIEALNLSISNSLSLRGRGLKVNSKDGSKEIFSAKDLFLDAELKPLLKRQLKIKKITLVKPTMSIAWKSKLDPVNLTNSSVAKKILEQEPPSQPDETKISDLSVTPGSNNYLMESIRNFLERPDLSLRAVEIEDATLTLIQSKNNSLPAREITIIANTQLELTNPNPNQVNVNGKLSNIEVEGLSFRGTLKANDLFSKQISINIDIESTSLPVARVNTLIEKLTSPKAISVKVKSGQIENVFIHLKGLINPNHDPFENIIVTNGFKISDLEISFFKNGKNGQITLPYLDGEGIWKKNTLNYEANGVLWGGSIQSSLVITLPEVLKGSFIGGINSETTLEGLNLSSAEFGFANKWKPRTGTAMGSIRLQGSIGEPSSTLRKYGHLYINDLTLGPEAHISIGHTALSLQQKSPQKTLVRIQIKDGIFNNVSIKTVGANLKIFPEKFSLGNGLVVPSNGIILFSGDYHPQLNTYMIRINGKKLRIEDFMTKQVEGSGFFKGMFQGNLNNAKKIQEKGETILFSHIADSLSGRLSIQLKDGEINTSPVIDELSNLLNPASALTPKKGSFNFKTFGGDLKIWEGRVVTENFELKGPQMSLEALMAANLVTGKLDGEVKVMPTQLLESITEAIPLLGNFLKEDSADIIAETYFRLGGTLAKPALSLEEDKTLFGKPTSILEDLVKTPR